MLSCESGSVDKGQRLLCCQYKPYMSPQAWGEMSVRARFEPCGLVVTAGSDIVELFLIGW